MYYITDRLDLGLLQFGPATATVREVDLRSALSLAIKERHVWLGSEALKQSLQEKGWDDFYKAGVDSANPELVGLDPDDRLLIIIPVVDSHLGVAQTGFRYFIASFVNRPLPPSAIVPPDSPFRTE